MGRGTHSPFPSLGIYAEACVRSSWVRGAPPKNVKIPTNGSGVGSSGKNGGKQHDSYYEVRMRRRERKRSFLGVASGGGRRRGETMCAAKNELIFECMERDSTNRFGPASHEDAFSIVRCLLANPAHFSPIDPREH